MVKLLFKMTPGLASTDFRFGHQLFRDGRRALFDANVRVQLKKRLALLAISLVTAGCMPTLNADGVATKITSSHPPLDIFSVTNRAPVAREDGTQAYGHDRSHALAYGSVAVSGRQAEEAVVGQPSEIGRFPETPYALEPIKGGVRRAADAVAAHERSLAEMQGELERRGGGAGGGGRGRLA